MQSLTEKEIIDRIKRLEPFTAVIDTGAFRIKIDRYVPAVGTAIHAGHNIHGQIADKILLDDRERRYEEDPFTEDMLVSFSIVLEGIDSRYQYDLNRKPDDCIYEKAWGKEVWREPLTAGEREASIARHASYYRVLHALIGRLERMFGRCILYDLHSYCYKRIPRDTPLFNIGTAFMDRSQYSSVFHHLTWMLMATDLPSVETRVALDEVFPGKGYQAEFIHTYHGKSLCIPLEIKKVYMDEKTGELYPLILETITEALKQSISYNASYFARKFAGKRLQRSAFFCGREQQGPSED